MRNNTSDRGIGKEAPSERFLWEHPLQIEMVEQGDGRVVLTPQGEVKT